MKPKKQNTNQGYLFNQRLSELLNPKQELFKLAGLIDWERLENNCLPCFAPNESKGQPPKPSRLMMGLLLLQQIYKLSDELVIERWVENGYWQYFCGYDTFQWKPPIDRSSLTRWRKRLGKEFLEDLLKESIHVAKKTKTVSPTSFKKVIADTTVMEKNIAHPVDAQLYDTARRHLVKAAENANITLRQNYNHVAKRHLRKSGRYAYAGQFRRMRKEVKKLKTYVERIYRDILRKSGGEKEKFNHIFPLVEKLLSQTKTSQNKLYSLYHPEVECIAKGKARKKYEFGCKVSLVVTHKEGLCVSSEAFHGNSHDSRTLETSIKEAEKHTPRPIEQIYVDRGYQGITCEGKVIYRSGQKRGITKHLRKLIKRRQAIEPHIGHMKSDGKLGRNYLKGREGDQVQAVLCGAAHNFRMILRKLKLLYGDFFHAFSSPSFLKNCFQYLFLVSH